MTSVCTTANRLAAETWTLLGYSYRRKGRGVDERGFTDRNLLELERHHPSAVWVDVFPQNREALTGADFEWWIGDGYRYLPMLVQAKRLGISGSYTGLSKRLPKPWSMTKQIDRLIEVCTTGRKGPGGNDFVGHVPAYLLYNTLTPAGLPEDRCCGYLEGASHRGCTIAHAEDVRQSLGPSPKRGARSITRIGRQAHPWGCLFCCPRGGLADPAERARLLLEGRKADRAKATGRPRTLDELPDYVLPAVERGLDSRESEAVPGAGLVLVTTIPPGEKEVEVEIRPPAA